MAKKGLRELLQDFALNIQLDWDANAPKEVYQKKIEIYYSKIQSLQVDWEFVKHTIGIVSRSFKKAQEAIEILKKEGILKRRK